MNDACCCIYSEGEPPSVYLPRKVRARKQHKCSECGATIEPGQRYEAVSGCWDGRWSHYKTCWPCLGIRDDFFTCGYTHTMMHEDFRECNGWDYCEIPTEGDERSHKED